MKLPNKVTSYSESILPLTVQLANRIKDGDGNITRLFHECGIGTDIADFISALDILFLTDKIELSDNGEVCYVG